MEQFCWYIPKRDEKEIITNVIVTVNSSIELQIIFYRWYVIFTDEYTDGQIKTPITLHTVFMSIIC
jgi:hypothetical protein